MILLLLGIIISIVDTPNLNPIRRITQFGFEFFHAAVAAIHLGDAHSLVSGIGIAILPAPGHLLTKMPGDSQQRLAHYEDALSIGVETTKPSAVDNKSFQLALDDFKIFACH